MYNYINSMILTLSAIFSSSFKNC